MDVVFVLALFPHADLPPDDLDLGGSGLLLAPGLFDEPAEVICDAVDVRHRPIDQDRPVGDAVEGKDRIRP